MTPHQVKRILKQNRKAGRRPWSLYQIAQMRGCSRALVTMTMHRPAKSRPLWQWIESVLGPNRLAQSSIVGSIASPQSRAQGL